MSVDDLIQKYENKKYDLRILISNHASAYCLECDDSVDDQCNLESLLNILEEVVDDLQSLKNN